MFQNIVAVCFLVVVVVNAQQKAVVVLSGFGSGVTGTIVFTQTSDGVEIVGSVSGLTEGNHGFHVHGLGDLTNGCTSTGSHFNPHNLTHGGPSDTVRHVGDLGNIAANSSGIAPINFTDSVIALEGEHNIIGRAIVVHQDEDDLGKGGQNDSLTTGHAGARLACGIIGTLSEDTTGAGFHSVPNSILVTFLVILLKAVAFPN